MGDKPLVGIDVSKHWLDLCCQGKSERIANTAAAIGAWLERVSPGLVAVEPTGGYERVLRARLRERAIAFVRVHPNRLVAFRRSRGVAVKPAPSAFSPRTPACAGAGFDPWGRPGTERIRACPRAG